MKDVALTALLEAGCHFGHKVDRWHPKAASFIYQAREGIHIIDLAKTRNALLKAAEYVKELGKAGKILLFVGTKRQAKAVVTAAAKRAQTAYLTNRWVGGFFTNWNEVKKNLDRVNKMRKDKEIGEWTKFPKHEQVALAKLLRKLEMVYEGVAHLTTLPDALFIVDIKREYNCLQEALRKEVGTVAIVDTNSDPSNVDYMIPANDDAVGSIQFIVDYIADAFLEGKNLSAKNEGEKVEKKEEKVEEQVKVEPADAQAVAGKKEDKKQLKKSIQSKKVKKLEEKKPKKKGRPKKLSTN